MIFFMLPNIRPARKPGNSVNNTQTPILSPKDMRARHPIATPKQTPIMLPMKSTRSREPISFPRLIFSTCVIYRHRIRILKKQIKVKSEEREIAVIRIPEKSHCIIYTEGDITTLAEDFGAYETKQVLEIQTKFEKSIYLKIEIELKEWRDEK